jgi:hypothetical protein
MSAWSCGEGVISARACPVSGREQTASRTTVPPILLTQNRLPHRRSRGRFAVPDPACSLPESAPVFTRSGGDHGTSAAYRRASGRTCVERRSRGDRADRGRAGGRPEGAGAASERPLIGAGERRGSASFPSRSMVGCGVGEGWRSARSGEGGVRQDERNGAMPCGLLAIPYCLNILFSVFGDGTIEQAMAPCIAETRGLLRFNMAPSGLIADFCHVA